MEKIYAVILHYQTYSDTETCVESIFKSCGTNLHIIIVDNGSPNCSGEELERKYQSNSCVTVIKTGENLGFARGNNVGFRMAKQAGADFIILMNNDLILKDSGFLHTLKSLYLTKKYAVLGPNIISLVDNQQQNPMPIPNNDIANVSRSIRSLKLQLLLSYVRMDRIAIHLVRHTKPPALRPATVKEQENIALHGSCLIFSPDYIKRYDGLFNRTFMYCEETILYYICMRDHIKMLYSPELTIYHKEDSATNAVQEKPIKKRRFFYRCSIDSMERFKELIQSDTR